MSGLGAGLVYLMGASGSGKDTLLSLAQTRLTGADRIAVARRVITRPGSVHEASLEVTEAQFEQMNQAGRFAMQWSSHGLRYGIGVEIDAWLAQGQVVIVNGSRGYLPQALARYPAISAVQIHVDRNVLAQRLASRGRETPEQISRRLAQAVPDGELNVPPPGTLHGLDNNAAPDAAAQRLLDIAHALLNPSLRNHVD
ncbi:phosphonate metabolism protein/1,5-bisphosphokinase (PRPP-forming) PhnN [Bordetella sp. FB-8]|uniref:phosphonate metabolism protein/1,5-bisphosphokinase (PRPP-forming) PhnN n=1 Tax=Bordetella sp. FB-8 TaxID=1159870 RepID=UPI00035D3BFD|nr:phosphonate metabolism protein/1,5-bisphosphokinase (PRPP-forming) PhnN [Bordetella sp. FB-8]